MAGHSKWANIKHRKAAQDVKRGKLFTKLIRELVVASRTGGSIMEDNPRLRAAVDKALSANMRRDTIDNAIARGAGNADGDDLEELLYEGYALGGIAVLVEVMTDNRNRSVAEVRYVFSKHGGSLGIDGSVAYLFKRVGMIQFSEGSDEEYIFETALDAGAVDILNLAGGGVGVLTPWESVTEIRNILVSSGLEPVEASVVMMPNTEVSVDADSAPAVLALIDMLEDLDDVQNVHTNAKIPEDLLA